MRKGKPLKGREKEAGADAAPPRNQGGDDDYPGPAAAGAGAAGGMVKPKGQHGKGKLTSNDPTVKDLIRKYGENREDCKTGAKEEMKKLREQAKQAKSPKERNKLLRRKDAIKGAIKLMDRYFMKTPLLLTPFTEDQLRKITNGVDPNSTTI